MVVATSLVLENLLELVLEASPLGSLLLEKEDVEAPSSESRLLLPLLCCVAADEGEEDEVMVIPEGPLLGYWLLFATAKELLPESRGLRGRPLPLLPLRS